MVAVASNGIAVMWQGGAFSLQFISTFVVPQSVAPLWSPGQRAQSSQCAQHSGQSILVRAIHAPYGSGCWSPACSEHPRGFGRNKPREALDKVFQHPQVFHNRLGRCRGEPPETSCQIEASPSVAASKALRILHRQSSLAGIWPESFASKDSFCSRSAGESYESREFTATRRGVATPKKEDSDQNCPRKDEGRRLRTICCCQGHIRSVIGNKREEKKERWKKKNNKKK